MYPDRDDWCKVSEACAKVAGICKVSRMRIDGDDSKPSLPELAIISQNYAFDLAMTDISDADYGTWEDVRRVLVKQLKRNLEMLNAE